MSGAGEYAPLEPLTPGNQGAANIIVAYFLIVTTLAFATVRFAVGRQRLLLLDVDDACFVGSVAFGITASVVSHLEVLAGLGRHQASLSSHDVERYFKLSYVDQFLNITAMALAKCSILLLFRRIMSQSRLVFAFITLSTAVALYFVFSIFAAAFLCGLPNPWILEPSTCPTHGRMLYAIIGLNMATDTLLAIWIIPSLWKLQMSKDNRAVVVFLFAARFVVVVTAAGQIAVTARALRHDDQTWYSLPRAIMDQVVMHVSIIHATIPRIHGFLANLQTGMLATRITTNIPLTNSKDRSGHPSKDDDTTRSGVHTKRSGKISLASIAGKTRKINNMLYVSSSSHDYAQYDEKDNDGTKGQDGNVINGMRLRPDIMPGSKWSTTIYADPAAASVDPRASQQQRSRQHSASTKDDREVAMGGRVDEEASTSSLTEGHSRRDDNDTDAPSVSTGQNQEAQQRIWKTKEFRMQIERVRGDGQALDITRLENQNPDHEV